MPPMTALCQAMWEEERYKCKQLYNGHFVVREAGSFVLDTDDKDLNEALFQLYYILHTAPLNTAPLNTGSDSFPQKANPRPMKLYIYTGSYTQSHKTDFKLNGTLTHGSILIVVDALCCEDEPPIQPVSSHMSFLPQEPYLQYLTLLLSQQICCVGPLPQWHLCSALPLFLSHQSHQIKAFEK